MRFAICNEMFEGWDFVDVCAAARDAGYSGVEVAPFTLGCPDAVTQADCYALRDTAERAGVEIVGLHWLLAKTTGLHINSPDSAVRERTVAHLMDQIDLCARLGGSVMVFGSPSQRSIARGMPYEQAWGLAVEAFRALAPRLEATGVTFCIEPLIPEETDFINTADEAGRMIREIGSPNIQLILDVKAMASEAKSIPQLIRENKTTLTHFHANDPNLGGPGFGNIDFGPIAAALKEIDYAGWVSVEVFDFTPDPITIAQGSMNCLRSVFV